MYKQKKLWFFVKTKRDQLNILIKWYYRPCEVPEHVYRTLVQDRHSEHGKFFLSKSLVGVWLMVGIVVICLNERRQFVFFSSFFIRVCVLRPWINLIDIRVGKPFAGGPIFDTPFTATGDRRALLINGFVIDFSRIKCFVARSTVDFNARK